MTWGFARWCIWGLSMCAVLLSSSPAPGLRPLSDVQGWHPSRSLPAGRTGCRTMRSTRPWEAEGRQLRWQVWRRRWRAVAEPRTTAPGRDGVRPGCKPQSARSGPTTARVQQGGCQVYGGGPRSAWGKAFSRSHRTCGAAHRAQARSGREPPARTQQVADRRARGSQPPGWRWQVGGRSPRAPKPLGAGNRVQECAVRPKPASRPAQG